VTSNIETLLSLASVALGPHVGLKQEDIGAMSAELYGMLAKPNGVYIFESALHVLPLNSSSGVMDLGRWNSGDVWRQHYGLTTNNPPFFAEDVFGGQFALEGERVLQFDPETGDTEVLSAL